MVTERAKGACLVRTKNPRSGRGLLWLDASRSLRLPVVAADAFERLADAEAIAELLELLPMRLVRAVEMLPFGEKLHLIGAKDAMVLQHRFERSQVWRVNHQKLVLVKLDLDRAFGRHHGDTGAAVVEEQVLVIATMALQDGQVHRFAEEVEVLAAGRIVARFHDDIDDLAEWVEQVEKDRSEERRVGKE